MTQQVSCLIIDDEPIARDIISNYCEQLPVLRVDGCCGNALDARKIIQSRQIDLIFLDINMPVLDGMAFLKTLKKVPEVIFTTAYREYAVEAFDLAACDYLLKPFSLDRFIVAVDKALDKLHGSRDPESVSGESGNEDYLFIRADGKIYKVFHKDLLYAEANGNYTKVVTNTRTLMVTMTFTNFETMLPVGIFVRIHRSYIVNKSSITHIEGNYLLVNNSELPIGTNYKTEFLRSIGL
jgi:DNA-binding LytR/AlgR family response regulator